MSARSMVVLLNPHAGPQQAEDLPARLAELFLAAGADAHTVSLQSSSHAAEAVHAAMAAGASTIVAAGGDGTIRSVAAALVDTPLSIGVLPLGSRNHFAKDLAIPLELDQAVATVIANHVVRVDVGEVNGSVFLNNSSIGMYPTMVVARESLRKKGLRKWMASLVATAKVLREYPGVLVRVTAGETTHVSRTPFLFVANNEYEIEGMSLGGRKRLDTGHLFAYLAPRRHGYELPRLLVQALTGRVKESDTLVSFSGGALDIETLWSRRVRVALDGEVLIMTTPLRYRARPGALNVIVP